MVGGAGMRAAQDHEQPIPQTPTEQKFNSLEEFIRSNGILELRVTGYWVLVTIRHR